uniref:Uncharacterized protein n=1 Tax=Parastrongyloides trichosuri TaxID=131310 RepID=A0A0N4ZPH5_PARTI
MNKKLLFLFISIIILINKIVDADRVCVNFILPDRDCQKECIEQGYADGDCIKGTFSDDCKCKRGIIVKTTVSPAISESNKSKKETVETTNKSTVTLKSKNFEDKIQSTQKPVETMSKTVKQIEKVKITTEKSKKVTSTIKPIISVNISSSSGNLTLDVPHKAPSTIKPVVSVDIGSSSGNLTLELPHDKKEKS